MVECGQPHFWIANNAVYCTPPCIALENATPEINPSLKDFDSKNIQDLQLQFQVADNVLQMSKDSFPTEDKCKSNRPASEELTNTLPATFCSQCSHPNATARP